MELKMNKSQLIELFNYNDWANIKLLNAVGQLEDEEFIRELSSSFTSIRDTMVHILGAEELWLSRWQGVQGRTLLNPDDFPTYASIINPWDDFRKRLNYFLESLKEEDIKQEFKFRNLKGTPYSLILWKQMLHVTNHSSFHRGQVITMLRQLKKLPPSLDLIYYYLGEK